MKEYIERKALIDKIFPIGMIDDGRYALPAKAVKIAIDNAPAADVVEVVRCKDCKHYKQNEYCPDDEMVCKRWAVWLYIDPDDFCSRGERKEK